MAVRNKARDQQLEMNKARWATVCGPKGVMAGLEFKACAYPCRQARELDRSVIAPADLPFLPLKGCRAEDCLCTYIGVTWIRVEKDSSYKMLVPPRR